MLLDIGVGIFLAMGLSSLFGIEITSRLVLAGVLFALLPDADVFVELWQRRGKLGGKIQGFHRTITHYPLLYVLAAFAVFITRGGFWALFFGFRRAGAFAPR